ncbi:MAG TPA: hypothetical protein VGE52_12995, partial [Pirellulales bacterium]
MWDALEPLDDRTLRRLRWAADVQFYVVALFLLMVLARQAASPYVLALYQHALVLGKQAEQLGPQRVEVDPTDPQADQSERTDDGWKAFKTTDAPFDRKAWVAKLDEYGDAVDRCIVV